MIDTEQFNKEDIFFPEEYEALGLISPSLMLDEGQKCLLTESTDSLPVLHLGELDLGTDNMSNKRACLLDNDEPESHKKQRSAKISFSRKLIEKNLLHIYSIML